MDYAIDILDMLSEAFRLQCISFDEADPVTKGLNLSRVSGCAAARHADNLDAGVLLGQIQDAVVADVAIRTDDEDLVLLIQRGSQIVLKFFLDYWLLD